MAYPLRKPLYEIERAAEPTTVCVTGGTGFIAGAIIARLLAAGHTVHATVRDPSSQTKLEYLKSLPGAETRLHFFKVSGPFVLCIMCGGHNASSSVEKGPTSVESLS